jgi:hypothetical protein
MNSFAEIIAALGNPPNGPWKIGDDPPLTVNYTLGPPQSLVAVLNAGVHITIYQNSWDGIARVTDCTGGQVNVGPYCLHATAGQQRWFRQYEADSWL